MIKVAHAADGSDIVTLASGQNMPDGVAVNANATRVFWGDEVRGGAILTAPLAGADEPDGPPTVLVPDQDRPEEVKVNGDNLYRADEASPGTPGTVMEADDAGSPVRIVVGSQDGPSGVAVNGSDIYWTNRYGGTLIRATLNGTGVTTLVSGWAGAQRRGAKPLANLRAARGR